MVRRAPAYGEGEDGVEKKWVYIVRATKRVKAILTANRYSREKHVRFGTELMCSWGRKGNPRFSVSRSILLGKLWDFSMLSGL